MSVKCTSSRLWSTLAILVLAIGILVRPALEQVGELHGLAHGLSEHTHHGLPDDGRDAEQDRSTLPHALLHQLDGCSSVGILANDVQVSVVQAQHAPPRIRIGPRIVQRGSVLLRPPIG